MRLLRRIDLNLILVVLLAVPALAPLSYPGFFQSHSGFLPIYNLYDLEQHLGHPGWRPAVGQAFDLLRGEGPLPYYLSAAFRWLGAGGAEAIKWAYGLSFALAALAMYGWVRRLWGKKAALVAAVVYTYLPYHLAVVYVRGSPAEAWFLALAPLALWALTALVEDTPGLPKTSATSGAWLRALAVVVSWLALFLAQPGLALWLTVLAAGYVFLLGRRRLGPLAALATGTGLGLASLLPAVGGQGLFATPPVDFYAHFLWPFQLFSPAWGWRIGGPPWEQTMSRQVGLVPLGLALLSVFLVFSTARDAPSRRVAVAFQIAALALVALLFAPAAPLWRVTGLARLLTYPWQLLGFIGLLASALAGAVVALDERLAAFPMRAALVVLAVVASYNYLTPRFFDFGVDFAPGTNRSHVYDLTPVGPPVAILGDNQVALLDYRIEGPLRHGATVRLNVLWQCLRPFDRDYTVFVHVLDGEGRIWGQQDIQPRGGEYPTTAWGLGEIVPDRYQFRIDVNGPRQGYRLEVGMYLADTGQRLPVNGGPDTRVLIEADR